LFLRARSRKQLGQQREPARDRTGAADGGKLGQRTIDLAHAECTRSCRRQRAQAGELRVTDTELGLTQRAREVQRHQIAIFGAAARNVSTSAARFSPRLGVAASR